MLTLINTNTMDPAIGPIGLDYVASSVRQAGIETEALDLGLADEPEQAIREYFSDRHPELIGLSFRNADDCFWPSADWFVPGLKDLIESIRKVTDAPIVLGGVGYSIFAGPIFEHTNVEFGICGDGETAILSLIRQLRGTRRFSDVPGLIWRDNGTIHSNPPSWPDPITLGTDRSFIDNRTYFKRGGQCGLETKRGCNHNCIYCADPLAKGCQLRLRKPAEVADEAESLLSQGIDVLHVCDSEFNVSEDHALTVCEEFCRRSLGDKIRWYTYMLPSPFDADLAEAMARAGCAGIDFTGDSACESMLRTYRQKHRREDLAAAVTLSRQNRIAVMIDLLLGGPGETPQTVRETIDFIKKIGPDCAGAALGMRVYPRTAMETIVSDELRESKENNIRRKYGGPIDLLQPTFYISEALGERPAEFVRDVIAGDQRFFEPAIEVDRDISEDGDAANYNYNENVALTKAIQKGARGAYWDILRQLRTT
ncbi:MAG: radical SAM protein [Candidatus Hydrogenedentota bacterium]|nr:MAG: radical SAM protein [Candidatus Hydrogenedentota bacterium]